MNEPSWCDKKTNPYNVARYRVPKNVTISPLVRGIVPSQKNPIAAPKMSADVAVTGLVMKAMMMMVRARYMRARGIRFDVTPPIQPKNNAPAILNNPISDNAHDAISALILLSFR